MYWYVCFAGLTIHLGYLPDSVRFVMGLYVISLVLVGLFYRPPPFPNPKDSSVSERYFAFNQPVMSY